MKKFLVVLCALALVFSGLCLKSNWMSAQAAPTIAKANVKIYVDSKLTKYTCLKMNNEYYFEINEISKALNYRIKLDLDEKGYLVSDFQNWKMYALNLNSSYVYGAQYEDKFSLDEDHNLSLKEKSHSAKALNKPLFYYSGKDYISLSALQFMNDKIKLGSNRIDLPKVPYKFNSTSFYNAYAKKNNIELEDIEVFEISLFDEESQIPDYFGGFNIIDSYDDAKRAVGKDYWVSTLIYMKKEVVNPKTKENYVGPQKMYYTMHVNQFNEKDENLEVTIEGVSGLQLSLKGFEHYIEASKTYAPYGLMTKDPKTLFKWSKQDWEAVDTLNFWDGMTTDMLKVTLGNPDEVTKEKYNGSPAERWYYDFTTEEYYLLIQDGIVIESRTETNN